MARQKGTANFSGTLEVLAGGPIDSRTVVPTLADLTVASNFPYAYVGLETYVVSENKKYRLIGADVTQSSNWEEVGSGGGGGEIDVDDELSTTSEDPVQNKVITTALGNKADLVDGKVPANQLPSYVDDVIEGYLVNNGALVKDIIAKMNEVAGTNITYTGVPMQDTRNLIASISGNQIVFGRFVNYSGKIRVVGSAAEPATSGAGEVYASSAQNGSMKSSMSTSGSTSLNYHYSMMGGDRWNWMPGTIYYNGPDVDVSEFSGNAVEIGEYRMMFYLDAQHTQAVTPEKGKIYVDLSTNLSYRWSGTTFICISNPTTVDNALSNSSINPVQNKVITTELNKKADSTSVPTQLSQLEEDSTHRTATDTEKSAWNGKQDKLTAGTNISISNNTINALFPVAVNKFDKSDLYSTTEKIVGCWTDGRPIYQKTIDCGNLPNATSKNVAHNISNLNVVTNIRGFVHNSSNNSSSPIDSVAEGNWSVAVSADRTNVIIQTWANYSTLTNFKLYVTIQYTKTTDAANSFKYADENDYSTTEHIVGSWIDGKPVYQKTIDCGALPNNTNKSIAHGISNFKQLIGLKGNAKSSANFIVIPHESPYDPSTGEYSIGCYATTTNIVLQTKQNLSSYTASYVSIQYTKTTD